MFWDFSTEVAATHFSHLPINSEQFLTKIPVHDSKFDFQARQPRVTPELLTKFLTV